jgi:K+-sensing histidine kinase KdpD
VEVAAGVAWGAHGRLRHAGAVRLLLAIGAVLGATVLALAIDADAAAAGPLLLLGVVVAALLGRWPGVAAGLAGAASYSFFFIPPERTFSLGKDEEPLALAVFLAIALVVGTLVSRATELRHAAEEREAVAIANLELADRIRAAELAAEEARFAAEASRTRAAFFAAAGHNLRTPLTSIATAVDTLATASDHLDDDERRDLMETIRDETARLVRLTARVLELSRLNAGIEPERSTVEVEGLVQAVIRRIGRLDEGRTFQLTVDDRAELVDLDVTMVEEALQNVIENAVRFAPPHTVVEVLVHATDTDVVLAVADHGPGVAVDERTRVFDDFYRGSTPRTEGGTGLGLAIARAVAEAHGGSIACVETRGGGATIEMRFPRSIATSPRPETVEVP